MTSPMNIAGKRFGNIEVLSRAPNNSHNKSQWLCQCDCGNKITVVGSHLKSGNTTRCKSCATAQRNTTHGQYGTPLHKRWAGIMSRCYNPNTKSYHHYGGRGIEVCPDWHKFENFARDMGEAFEPYLELDRIDNNGNYSPNNCRWTNRTTNASNTRTNHLITFNSRTQTLTQWAEEKNIRLTTLWSRLQNGWSIEKALTTPTRPLRRQ